MGTRALHHYRFDYFKLGEPLIKNLGNFLWIFNLRIYKLLLLTRNYGQGQNIIFFTTDEYHRVINNIHKIFCLPILMFHANMYQYAILN